MYEAYWQLNAKPFETTSDARFYYPGESHQAALLKLRYAIESKREAALLAGAAGLGKTLLVGALARLLPPHCQPLAHLVFPCLPPEQLVAAVAYELTGQAVDERATLEQQVRRIRGVLSENAAAQRHAVIVIDEAHLLREAGSLETVRLLLNLQVDGAPAMTLVLLGHTALLPMLERLPELDERLGVKCLLRRFTLEETMGYVTHRLSAAGGGERPLFDISALEAVHTLSQGAPRQINRLCDLALLIGFADEREQISAEQIEAVAHEFVAVTPE